MPNYVYQCCNCFETFELMQSIKDKPKTKPDVPCKKCHKKYPIKRLISSGGGIIFKGTGFYETDYRSENYKKSEKAEKKV